MKLNKNRKYLSIALYAFLVIAAAMIFFFILLSPDKFINGINTVLSIFAPLIIGFILSFILNPIMNFFEKTLKFLKQALSKQQKKQNAES